jgi:hypothetical protein
LGVTHCSNQACPVFRSESPLIQRASMSGAIRKARMYASKGFSPNMREGQSAGRMPGACVTGASKPSIVSANPPLNNANELVQMFLMIGFTPAMAYANAIITTPATTNAAAERAVSRRVNTMPASAPSSTLKQAGQVDRMPSGSKTTRPSTGQCGKKCSTPMTARSMTETQFHSGS